MDISSPGLGKIAVAKGISEILDYVADWIGCVTPSAAAAWVVDGSWFSRKGRSSAGERQSGNESRGILHCSLHFCWSIVDSRRRSLSFLFFFSLEQKSLESWVVGLPASTR